MYRDKDRYGQDPTTVLRSKPGTFNAPLKWPEPETVFTCSWSDFFIEEADAWRADAWGVIRNTPHHTYQILTKRPERVADNLPEDFFSNSEAWRHVWFGVSIESQEQIGRIEKICKAIKDIEGRIFLSLEPLIGPIDFRLAGWDVYDTFVESVSWVIVGGESGNESGKWGYRPSELHWYRSIVEECRETGIPIFVKQLGTHLANELNLSDRHGRDIEEFPEYLQIRENPTMKKRESI